METIITPAQRTASALKRLDRTLRNWQDDPNSPRTDVDKMLAVVQDLRQWVQGHILSDVEHAEELSRLRNEVQAMFSSQSRPPRDSANPGGGAQAAL